MSWHRRRRDITKLVKQRKKAATWEPVRQEQTALSRALDNLNAFGLLDEVQRRPPNSFLCFGPKDVSGGQNPAWSGSVVWFRRTNYHSYETLLLLGIWATGDLAAPQIIAGTRTLMYNGQPYNPEAYFHHLQRDFQSYYDGSPSPASSSARIYERIYMPSVRLEMRQQLEQAIIQWREGLHYG
jgi:hypothetical protein